jgi:glycosyltransferase involved in cell wall biosynthesis
MSSNNKKVLIVVENLPLPLDRRVWQESCALRDAGYEVAVICPKMRGYNTPYEVLEGIHLYRHWISDEAGGFLGFFAEYASALWGEFWLTWKVWSKHHFKIIHLCNPPDLLFLLTLPFKLLGVKVIYDVHDVWPEFFEAKFGKRGLFYWAVRAAERASHFFANTVLATNESVKEIAMTRGKKSDSDVFVVRTAPSILTAEVTPDPSLKHGRKFLVGYVGVMGNADGVGYLIEAAAHIVNDLGRRDVQFLLMGTGPEFNNLLEMRARHKLEDFLDMPGRVSNEFLFTALQTIDLGASADPINSYNNHCTMNKVLEYMAFGKPQVMFDLKEGRASAQSASLYVPENSGKALARGILELLDDPTRREQMGLEGKKRFTSELNWGKSVENLVAAYQKTLKS